MKMNKRAQMEDFLQLVVWSIVMVVVLFIFIGVKTAKVKSLVDQSEEIEKEIDTNYLLVNFLKQKIENPDAENMAELIVLYYETEDEKIFDEVEKEASDFFSKSFLEASRSSWTFRIYDKEKKEIKKIDGSLPHLAQLTESENILSSIIIPAKKDGEYIILEISLIKIGEYDGDYN